MSSAEDRHPGKHRRMALVVLSVATRAGVLALLCLFALWTDYLNLKVGYNSARLVELSDGKAMRIFYQASDALFTAIDAEEPVRAMQRSGGMTWSIRILGVPFTDPIAALSVGVKHRHWPLEFMLGLGLPLLLALTCGRVFCAYICPASLLFFTVARVRRLLQRYFFFPNIRLHSGFAWGVLAGGLIMALLTGHGIWTLLLPYLAMGQTIFHGLALGTLAAAAGALVVFALADLLLGDQFTCRNLCPTGRLLGAIGTRAVVAVRRDESACISKCTSCIDVCPLAVKPKLDETHDCSLCGECVAVCPTNCLSVGVRAQPKGDAAPNVSAGVTDG
jgi:ferredoxin-type protein NapH